MLKKYSPSSLLLLLGLAIATSFLILQTAWQGVGAPIPESSLPALQVHSLPPSLAQWQDTQNLGDYFEQVKPTSMGYLVWSQFPLKVYFDRPSNLEDTSASNRRFQAWVKAVAQAIGEWQAYLPLVTIEKAEKADIIILRSPPPLGATLNPETGKLNIPRARSAQTRYEFYLREGNLPLLYHRLTLLISPTLSESAILSATRHEIGHALGIWGHSPVETDALYFSQVRNPPPISARDINTLKKVYQQPTRLGWALNP